MSGNFKRGDLENIELQDNMISKDDIELQFARKEWGVRLADEMRRDAGNGAHPETPPTETFLESLQLSPFDGLDEQATRLRPGNELEDIRAWNQLSRKLRTEYAGMRALILRVNEAVKEKTESLRLKVALELCALYKLILDDGLAQPLDKTNAPVPEEKTDDDYQEEEKEFMMSEAALYDDQVSGDDEIFLELPGKSVPPGPSPNPGFTSQIQSWAADSTSLVMAVFAHKAAAKAIQEKYFDGHPILFEKVEVRLEETVKAMEDAAATFNEYLKIRESREAPGRATEMQGHGVMDIQAIRARVGRQHVDPLVAEWVEYAKNKAIAEIRKESEEIKARVPMAASPQGQICEIPITVQGSRNTRIPQPFLEETYTAIVSPNGAVLRLLEVVTHGQIVIIQNMRLKQEAACRVVTFKPSTTVEGNVQVEFIQPAPGFWGIDFPGEIPGAGIEAAGRTQVAPPPSVPARRHAEPAIATPPAPEPQIHENEKQAAARIVEEVIPLEREAEIAATPAAEVHTETPAAQVETLPETASPAPQIEDISGAPVAKPTPEDSLALNAAIIAAYAMRAPATPEPPAPPPLPIPPSNAEAPAASDERADRSKVEIVDASSEPVRESAAVTNSIVEAIPFVEATPIVGTTPIVEATAEVEAAAPPEVGKIDAADAVDEAEAIELIETPKETFSKPAPALEKKEIKPAPEEPLIAASPESAKHKKIIAISVAAVVLMATVAGATYWRMRSNAALPTGAAQSERTAAQIGTAAAPPQAPPADANTKPAPSTNPILKAPAKQKQPASNPAGSAAGKTATSKPVQDSADLDVRQPSTLPFQIGAPVTRTASDANTRADNTVAAPEINAPAAAKSAGSPNALLGSIASSTPPPAPPRLPVATLSERNYVEPRVLFSFPVVYPKIALQRRDQGDVMVTAMIDDAGTITGAKAISGPMMLREAAVNAVNMWKFAPAKLNGKPTNAFVTVKVTFKLPN
jgi:periplasmic protein TonB